MKTLARRILSSKYLMLLNICLICLFIVTACVPAFGESIPPTQITSSAEPAFTDLPPTVTKTKQPTSTSTQTPVPPTATMTATPTEKLVFNEPGKIDAPILLYHHINGENLSDRYTVSITDFREQMETLKEMGYTPIPISLFLNALLGGAEIPEKPIVITFDDGHESVYTNAFPIMKELDFVGVFYIVANRIRDVEDFVNVEQLKEMIGAGWEIGSHSFTHADLTKNHGSVSKEIGDSKTVLEQALGTKIETFAYPFGTIDSFLAQSVSNYLYRAGMGLGTRKIHTWNNLFYLERIEIYGNYSLEQFITLLSSN